MGRPQYFSRILVYSTSWQDFVVSNKESIAANISHKV